MPGSAKRKLGIAVFLAAVFFGALLQIGDRDFWWHLASGEWMLDQRQIPSRDFYSFTFAGQPWHYLDVLSDLLLAAVHRGTGPAGISLLLALTATAIFGLGLHRLLVLQRVSLPAALLSGLVLFSAARFKMIPRPETFSLICLVVYLWLLESYRIGRSRWRLRLLLLLQVIWINVHQSGLLGVIFFALFVAAEGWEARRDPARRGLTRILEHGGWFLLLALASLVNTAGVWIWRSPFQVSAGAFSAITEWQPLWALGPLAELAFQAAIIFFTLLLIVCSRSGRRSAFSAFLVIAAAAMAVRHLRFIPIFCLAAWPALAVALDDLAATFPRARWKWAAGWLVAGGCLTYLFIFRPDHHRFGLGIEPGVFPEGPVRFLQQHELSGNLFNDFQFGGYLLYQLHPAVKVFIDGRNNVLYDESFFALYRRALREKTAWAEVRRRYPIDLVLLTYDNRYSSQTPPLLDPEWRLLYWDEKNVLLSAVRTKKEKILTQEGYQLLNLADPLRQVAELSLAGEAALILERDLQKALDSNPDNLIAHYLLAQLYRRQGNVRWHQEVERVRILTEKRHLPPLL